MYLLATLEPFKKVAIFSGFFHTVYLTLEEYWTKSVGMALCEKLDIKRGGTSILLGNTAKKKRRPYCIH